MEISARRNRVVPALQRGVRPRRKRRRRIETSALSTSLAPTFLARREPALHAVLIVLGLAAVAALVASFAWDVEAMAAGAPWRLAGLEPRACPGCAACGLSRAFSAVSHGRWLEALHFNAAVAALYPAACFAAFLGAAALVRSFRSRSL